VPILTFVNKLDREGRDPFHLLDEIEQSLALDVTPASWPIGIGRDFLGALDDPLESSAGVDVASSPQN
jgi:peptide chain release factor 3